MKLAVMQPYFFPYLGQFHLIQSVDKWLAFDTVQYIEHGWMNRNRILHPNTGWQYVVVPIRRRPKNTPIKDVEISPNHDFRKKLLVQLDHYRRQAPYFNDVISQVEDCLSCDEVSISRLNVKVLAKTCAYLGVNFDFDYLSQSSVRLVESNNAGDRVLEICKAYGASKYVSPEGGLHLLDIEKFSDAGIEVLVQDFYYPEYATGNFRFEPNLSIIDVMMWNSPRTIRSWLQTQILQSANALF